MPTCTSAVKPAVARLALVLALVGGAPLPLLGHVGEPLAPHDLWSAWGGEPWVLLGLGVSAAWYARGVRRLWGRAGRGRGINFWRFNCFAGAIAFLFVALASPLDPLGGSLFAAHMVQHEFLILAAAPLIVLGKPYVAFVWALPRRHRKVVGRLSRASIVRAATTLLTAPVVVWILHASAVWLWHIPSLYQSTLTSSTAHALQHISFLGTAVLFWWVVLHPSPRRRLHPGAAVIYLFTTALYGSALGALLTFSPEVWYPAYGSGPSLWGLTQIEDQQLGGLIMWIPFGTIYTLAALSLLYLWFRDMEVRQRTVPVQGTA